MSLVSFCSQCNFSINIEKLIALLALVTLKNIWFNPDIHRLAILYRSHSIWETKCHEPIGRVPGRVPRQGKDYHVYLSMATVFILRRVSLQMNDHNHIVWKCVMVEHFFSFTRNHGSISGCFLTSAFLDFSLTLRLMKVPKCTQGIWLFWCNLTKRTIRLSAFFCLFVSK